MTRSRARSQGKCRCIQTALFRVLYTARFAGMEPLGDLSRTTVKAQKNTGRKVTERAAFNNVTNVVSDTQGPTSLAKDLSATFSPAKVLLWLGATHLAIQLTHCCCVKQLPAKAQLSLQAITPFQSEQE